jgi:hypothetical protein
MNNIFMIQDFEGDEEVVVSSLKYKVSELHKDLIDKGRRVKKASIIEQKNEQFSSIDLRKKQKNNEKKSEAVDEVVNGKANDKNYEKAMEKKKQSATVSEVITLNGKANDEKASDSDKINSTTNFVVAKLSIHSFDGFYKEIQLHDLMCESQQLVFDSSFKELLSFEEIKKSCYQNIQHTNMENILNKLVTAIQEKVAIIDDSRLNLNKIISRYSITEPEKLYEYGDQRTKVEQQMKMHIMAIEELEYKHKIQLNIFLKTFWHSEAKLLHFLRCENKVEVFLNDIAYQLATQSSPVELILLHLHSTYNICDVCREQITRATYVWLYEKITFIFTSKNGSNKLPPIFHIIASFDEVRPNMRIDLKTPKSGGIRISEVATLLDIKNAFLDIKKPVLSIVKLTTLSPVVVMKGNEEA